MKFDPYETLDVPRDADAQTIKRAYRRKAKKNHPDAGGDPPAFHAASRAVALLLNPDRRKRYDETGQIDESSALNDPLTPARELILNFFVSAAASPHDIFQVDLVEKCREQLMHHIREIENQVRVERNKIARFNKMEKRLKHKDKNDFVRQACRVQSRDLETVIGKHEAQIEIRNQALTILMEYQFEHDPPPAGQTYTVATTATTGTWR